MKEEIIKIKSSVLKRIKDHARKGYEKDKSEVIGYLIGKFKPYFIAIMDIIIPNQKSTNTHAEIIDEISLIDYLEKNESTNRIQVGWYHSHPDLGCFLSTIDIPTQKYWQCVNIRMIALVIDPIRDIIKVFRLNEKNQVYEIPIKNI